MTFQTRKVDEAEVAHYQGRQEDQFFDRKSASIKPSKLSQSFSALANADGGELFVGIEDEGSWVGFSSIEAANAILQTAADQLTQRYYSVEFVHSSRLSGYGLIVTIERHPNVVESTAKEIYQRQSASNRKLEGDDLQLLLRAKGENRYELTSTTAQSNELENSNTMIDFMVNGDAFAEPSEFLSKNLLVSDGRGTIASTVLFSDLPQAHMPTAAVKIYRYKTNGEELRDHLAGKPETVEGPLTVLISKSRQRVAEIVADIPRLSESGFEAISYPTETLHEILTNAMLHRDYGIPDYVHVRVFDNRVEVDSPGRLHGHVTVNNILDERSARNPQIQRIVNKFPDAPNQDIGEGLNTAFKAMESLRLRYPEIEELSDRVRVTIRHETLASPEKAIMEAALKAGSINNSEAREATKIDQERTIRRLFETLVISGQLERWGSGRGTRYYPTEAADGNPASDG